MIRIETARLVRLLTDLSHTTADPTYNSATAGIVLYTVRGYLGDEPGQIDLLVGTSTNGYAVGHTNCSAHGQMPVAMHWPINECRAVIAAFKPRLKESKDHALEIRRDGDEITVGEDPNLFGEGLSLTFTQGPLAKFPRHVWSLLSDVQMVLPDEFERLAPRSDYSAIALEPFVKVAKGRGEPIEVYRYHHRLPQLVQIGHNYRGVISARAGWIDTRGIDAGGAPQGEIYPPTVPLPELEDADT